MKRVGLLLGLVLGACGGAAPDWPDDVRWTSAHFDYYTRHDETEACESLVAVFEQHFTVMQSALGFEWADGDKISYRKFVDVADFDHNSPCPQRSGGCAPGQTAHSPVAFEQHELIHTYLARVGRPPSLFLEGVAVALSCDPRGLGRAPTLSWDQALNDPDDFASIYPTAGVLVSHLLRRFNIALFMELYRSLPSGAGPAEVDAKMRQLYGASAENIWQDALADRWGCVPLWPCSRESIPVDGTPVALGAQCGLQQDYRRFDVAADSNVVVSSTGNRGMRLLECDADGSRPDVIISDVALATGVGLTQVAAGRYYVEFASRPSEVAVTIPTRAAAGPDCATLEPLVIPADPAVVVRVVIPPMTPSWFVKLRVPEAHRFAVGSLDTMTLSVCGDCDGAAPGCEPAPLLPRGLTANLAGDYVLHFRPAPEEPKAFLPTAAELEGF